MYVCIYMRRKRTTNRNRHRAHRNLKTLKKKGGSKIKNTGIDLVVKKTAAEQLKMSGSAPTHPASWQYGKRHSEYKRKVQEIYTLLGEDPPHLDDSRIIAEMAEMEKNARIQKPSVCTRFPCRVLENGEYNYELDDGKIVN